MIGDLASPRGIALGPAGEIYVADIGAASQPGSGRVLPIMADGTTAPILVSAANFTAAPHGETYIYGLSDVAVQADSPLFSVGCGATGNGALGVPNRLLRLGPTGALSPVFDFDRVEQERDPDGRGAGSNATGIAPAPSMSPSAPTGCSTSSSSPSTTRRPAGGWSASPGTAGPRSSRTG